MCRLAFSHANWTSDNFLEPLGLNKCLGSDNMLHVHSQDDQEGLECTLVGHLKAIGCFKEYFVIFIQQTLNQPIIE